MKKKPAKRTNEKPVLNTLSPQHPDYGKPKSETKISMGDLYNFFKQEGQEKRSRMKRLAQISARKRKEDPPDSMYDWYQVEEKGREIRKKYPSYSRHRIAQKIHKEIMGERGIRSIWNHLNFIPTLKRNLKKS